MNNVHEHTILKQGDVEITNVRAIIGSKTYAMANITSVSMTAHNDRGGNTPLTLIILGAMIGLGFFVVSFIEGTVNWVLVCISWLVVMGFFGLGVFVYINSKPLYSVRLGSSSGEINILDSYDPAPIKRIVDAVNVAIISRG